MGELKALRIEKKLTQQEAADLVGISLRSYKMYENEEEKSGTLKYRYMVDMLMKVNFIDEEHGVLTLEGIKEVCSDVLKEYGVEYAYLFGSYAKGNANENSDVDLLVSMPVNGLVFYELIETLREKLKKKVDLLDVAQINNNPKLVQEILREGIKIYG